MTRVPDNGDRADGPRPVPRWVVAAAIAGTVFIALGAFWLSFTSLADLAARAGIGQAWAWPLIVDGIIVVATISVVALSPYGRRAIWYPWLLLIFGQLAFGNHAVVVIGIQATRQHRQRLIIRVLDQVRRLPIRRLRRSHEVRPHAQVRGDSLLLRHFTG